MHSFHTATMMALAIGAAYRSEDVYASFGVNNAVISSSDISEHEQNMLSLDVSARDGDDSITLEEPEEGAQEEELEQEEPGEQEEQDDESGEESGEEGDFKPLPEATDELTQASEALAGYADGFDAMRAQAIANGLPEDMASKIEAEYESDKGLSDASYAALEKAGYSRQFVDSYIKGQEAIAEQFVSQVVQYAGGQESFTRVLSHMKATSPDSVETLYEAIERQDLKAIRTVLNLGMQGMHKKVGKAPARNVTKAVPATPARRAAPAAQGYTSKSEMIADMSKAEYRLDPAFRAKVEARVAASSF